MTPQDAVRFETAMQVLGETFETPLSELRITAYFAALSDLSIEDVCDAIGALLQTAKFFPKPVEIREAVCGNPADLTEQAWLSWKLAARQFGGNSSMMFSDPALADTLVAVFGGWPQACYADLSPEMWSSKRKEFDRVYRVLSARGLHGTRHLQGTEEQQNGAVLPFTTVGCLDGLAAWRLGEGERQRLLAEAAPVAEPVDAAEVLRGIQATVKGMP